MSREFWREVCRDGDVTWEVSDRGRVRSIRLLSLPKNNHGYHKVNLGRCRQEYVHRLVARAFIGPVPTDENGYETHTVDHIDFNPSNNDVSNLRYLPMEENTARQQRWEEDSVARAKA